MAKRFLKVMVYRKPTASEVRLLTELARAASGVGSDWVDTVTLENMNDGGMGSLRLRLANEAAPSIKTVRIGSELIFKDVDGVDVIASLYLSPDGVPVELDMWKVDFSPVITIPDQLPPATVHSEPGPN